MVAIAWHLPALVGLPCRRWIRSTPRACLDSGANYREEEQSELAENVKGWPRGNNFLSVDRDVTEGI